MLKLPLPSWIGNAAAVLTGEHGDVTAAADKAGCSRQTAYDHADKVQLALLEARLPGPARSQLLAQVEQLRQENAALRRQLANRIDFDQPRQKRLAATAAATGLSLNQLHELFRVLLDDQPADAGCRPAPSRATLGRWVLAAGLCAGVILAVLDRCSRPLAHTLCLDEIFFHGQPVLVAVEPHSMAVLLCDKAADRSGPTWQKVLQPFDNLEHVVSDDGSGLQAGLRAVQRSRPAARPLTCGLDIFHLEMEARKVLGWLWRKVEARWAKAEKADARAAKAKPRQRGGRLSAARSAWQQVAGIWSCYERWEGAWTRLKAALSLFRADGSLNDRSRARAEIRAACARLPGPKWAKVRRQAQDVRLLTFLDRLRAKLVAAEPRRDLREALVELWRLEQGGGQAAQAQSVVVQALCMKLSGDWEVSYAGVRAALGGVVRASSAVECVNSVLRMQQSRHRNVSQAMLDLKRLYWNCRVFEQGQRRDRCPYQHLGLALPTYDFCKLLACDPAELTQKLSSCQVAA